MPIYIDDIDDIDDQQDHVDRKNIFKTFGLLWQQNILHINDIMMPNIMNWKLWKDLRVLNHTNHPEKMRRDEYKIPLVCYTTKYYFIYTLEVEIEWIQKRRALQHQ